MDTIMANFNKNFGVGKDWFNLLYYILARNLFNLPECKLVRIKSNSNKPNFDFWAILHLIFYFRVQMVSMKYQNMEHPLFILFIQMREIDLIWNL